MAVTAVLLFGSVSLDRMALNLLPEISYPSLTVQTDYEDAAPEEIESLLTRPVEEAVGVVGGLNRISSVSRPGQSEVVLEFNWDVDMNIAAVDVREKLDLIEFPEDAQRPVILRFDPSNDPIVRVQVHGGLTLARLRDIAEREFKKRLEAVEGVAAVRIVGGREEQIRIEIDEKRVAELGIPITQVTDILRQENLNQASGSLYDLDMNYMVRMVNEFRSVDEVREIVIADRSGRKILVKDIARVWRGSKERDIIARFNGSESVEMAVYKEGDANTVTVCRSVSELLESMKEESTYPNGVETSPVFDQSRFIVGSVSHVLSSALVGGILATCILFIFLRDGRSTAIVAASIPISVMATFAAMYQSGITLNLMSLGGVALGVGMLVDNSIVVLEAVHRHRKPGKPLSEAVYEGTSEVSMPVTASTLTTVAVFLPLGFVEGIGGQLFRDQALTITFALLASLAVALTVIPMLLAARLRQTEEFAGRVEDEPKAPTRGRLTSGLLAAARFAAVEAPRVIVTDIRHLLAALATGCLRLARPYLAAFDRGFERLSAGYSRWLEAALSNKSVTIGTVLVSVGLAGAALRFLGGELIPSLWLGEFSFQLELPDGRPLEVTDRLMRRVESETLEIPEVAAVFSTVGTSRQNQFASGTLEENVGTLSVILADQDNRAAEAAAIGRVREILGQLPEVDANFEPPELFSSKTPVEVEIFAFELEDQRAAAELIVDRLAGIEGLQDIETTTRLGSPEVQIRFDRRRMNRLGLQEERVTRVLRNKIQGNVATRYREGERQIEVLVRVDEPDRNAVSDIRDMVINSAPRVRGEDVREGTADSESGTNPEADFDRPAQGRGAEEPEAEAAARPFVPIRLGQIADVEIRRGPAEIRRIRSQRAAIVRANLSGRDLASVTSEIREMLGDLRQQMPVAATAAIGGQNQELETSFRSLGFAMALAVFLVYLVMASQFESLLHPFVILLTVPLGLVGMTFALAVTGLHLNVVVLLGAIVLAGIAVNNGIVLVDFTNRLRQQGLAKRDALLQAGQIRLRPILMTSLTTLLGLVPMAFGWGEGDEIRVPMAVALMGGLISTTPFTLIVIPVVYELVDRKQVVPTGSSAPIAGPIQAVKTGPDPLAQN